MKKSTTFISNIEDFEDECDMHTDEGISNAIVLLLGRQFNKVMKKMEWKTKSNVKNKSFDINKNKDFSRRSKTEEKTNQRKGIQCHGCEGFGHIRAECPMYLKKQKKGQSISWSEDDS